MARLELSSILERLEKIAMQVEDQEAVEIAAKALILVMGIAPQRFEDFIAGSLQPDEEKHLESLMEEDEKTENEGSG